MSDIKPTRQALLGDSHEPLYLNKRTSRSMVRDVRLAGFMVLLHYQVPRPRVIAYGRCKHVTLLFYSLILDIRV